MGHEKPKASSGMVAQVRRLQNARSVLRAIEQRTRTHRKSATDKPVDVAKRLAANQSVRVVVRRMLDGSTDE
ncbi:hypothetical protein [Paraburkholderia sp. MM5477-R1]|uniref:hypothetical protein n=1 Tax=Paraburkholderia sp. MM5477-R1 TaxID=2991062 RepID=UPI003D1B2970